MRTYSTASSASSAVDDHSLVVSSHRRPERIANHIRKSRVEIEKRVAVAPVE
jgi:phosphoribosylcarboxyaminoimidazole (NCAIR) mutase